jgi:hypothetical protein
MPACIGAEQTVYLPGREIGDGAFHTQLVAANLSLLGQRGTVVLLDIAKAFDTIDRAFLLAIVERCGGGPGMHRWIHLLLQHTPASVVVRGRAAAPVLWLAGVRQGCPLSPLLYPFLAEASARWLRADCALGLMQAARSQLPPCGRHKGIPIGPARRHCLAPPATYTPVWPGLRPIGQPAQFLGRPTLWRQLSHPEQQCRRSADCG